MEATNDFGQYYRTISNTELLSILDNASQYQPSAVEAAQNELLARQLSDEEIKKAREILTVHQKQKEKDREKIKEIEGKVKATGRALIEALNPIQPEKPSTEKTIRLIIIVFGGLFLYTLLKDFSMHIAFVKDFPQFPFTSTLYFMPLITLPIALFTFWKKMRIGWSLFTIYLTLSTIFILWGLIRSLLWEPSGFVPFDSAIGPPPLLTLFIQLLFYTGTIYLVCKQNIRDIFSVGKNKMVATIIITGTFSLFAAYSSLGI